MFLGTYTPKLDDKGRLTLPAKFRDALAGGLMVTKSQDHSLAVYPRAEFEALAKRASGASRSERDVHEHHVLLDDRHEEHVHRVEQVKPVDSFHRELAL